MAADRVSVVLAGAPVPSRPPRACFRRRSVDRSRTWNSFTTQPKPVRGEIVFDRSSPIDAGRPA